MEKLIQTDFLIIKPQMVARKREGDTVFYNTIVGVRYRLYFSIPEHQTSADFPQVQTRWYPEPE